MHSGSAASLCWAWWEASQSGGRGRSLHVGDTYYDLRRPIWVTIGRLLEVEEALEEEGFAHLWEGEASLAAWLCWALWEASQSGAGAACTRGFVLLGSVAGFLKWRAWEGLACCARYSL